MAGVQGLEEATEVATSWKEYAKDLYRTGELEMGFIAILLVGAGINSAGQITRGRCFRSQQRGPDTGWHSGLRLPG